jgi:hypothetical protein
VRATPHRRLGLALAGLPNEAPTSQVLWRDYMTGRLPEPLLISWELKTTIPFAGARLDSSPTEALRHSDAHHKT